MDPTSTNLLARLAAGPDAAAWAALVERHLNGMRRAAAAAAGAIHADDAVQEALLLVRDRAGSFRSPTPDDGERAATAWLRTIAANCALHLARSARRRRLKPLQEPAMASSAGHDPAAALIADEQQALLHTALTELPERDRRPIVLRFFAGLDGKDALGAALGCSPDAAGMRLHRALERLRDHLARLGVVLSVAGLSQHLESAEAASALLPGPSHVFVQACHGIIASPTISSLPIHAVIPRPENLLMRFAFISAASLVVAGVLGVGLLSQEATLPPPTPPPVPAPAAWTPPASVPDGIADLGAALYLRLGATPGNLAFSPACLHASLAMLSAGARGRTLEEMERAVALPRQAVLHDGWVDLRQALAAISIGKSGDDGDLSHSIMIQRGFAGVDPFLDLCRKRYGATAWGIESRTDPDTAARATENWILRENGNRSNHNKRMNLRLFNEDAPSPSNTDLADPARLVLASFIHLRLAWKQPFKPDATQNLPFHRGDSRGAVLGPMMFNQLDAGFADLPLAQVVSLSYRSTEVEMVVVVPKEVDGLSAITAGIDGARLRALASTPRQTRPIRLTLPRLDFSNRRQAPPPPEAAQVNAPQPRSSSSLRDAFRTLGMATAFEPQTADLSGMSTNAGSSRLYLDDIIHYARIEVNEEGTLASADTIVPINELGDGEETPDAVTVNCDRPFLLLLRHAASGTILFMARIADPFPGGPGWGGR